MKVLLIAGKSQSGKDTFAAMAKKELEEARKKVLVIHYADLLKFICTKYFGWNGEKDEYGRTLLQQVGTEKVRAQDNDFWVRSVCDILRLFNDSWDVVLIPDVRFPNEIEGPTRVFKDTTVIRMQRNYDGGLTLEQQAHSSETALDDYIYDFVVDNNGTLKDLEDKVWEVLRCVRAYS